MWCHMTLWDKKLKVVTSAIFILSLEVDIFKKKIVVGYRLNMVKLKTKIRRKKQIGG